MAHIASHHQAIGPLRLHPVGKGRKDIALRGAIVQIGGDQNRMAQGNAVFQSSDWPETGGAPALLQATGQVSWCSLSAPTVALALWTVEP